ncbi:hypothetical protein U1Q18_035494 [Sarracenia purpurea var. burkii]
MKQQEVEKKGGKGSLPKPCPGHRRSIAVHCRKRAPAAAPPPPAQATPSHHAQPLVAKPAQFSGREGRSGCKEKRRSPDRRCCIIAVGGT